MLTTLVLLTITAPTRLAFVTEVPTEVGGPQRIDDLVEEVALEWLDVEVVRPGTVFGGAQSQVLETCGPDLACLSRELGYLEVGYLVLIVATRIDDRIRLVVRLVDTNRTSVVAKDARDWSPPSAAELQDSLRKVLGGLPAPRKSQLSLRALPSDADVIVESHDGSVVARGIGPHTLAPGRYLVRAGREGHDPVTRDVDLVGGQQAEVGLELRPTAVEWYASPWFWGIAVGVVAAGVVTGVVVSSSRSDECLCIGRNPAECPPPC